MSASGRQCFREFVQNVNPGGSDASFEVRVYIQVLAVYLISFVLSAVELFSQFKGVGVVEVPLIVGIVLEDFESFIYTAMHATHSATHMYITSNETTSVMEDLEYVWRKDSHGLVAG